MINITNLSIQRGNKILINNSSLCIYDKQKIGIVGANGCGKSTLFAALRGQIACDHGSINISKGSLISFVDQKTPDLSISALEYVMKADYIVDDLLKQKQKALEQNNAALIARLEESLDIQNYYTLQSRSSSLLLGLGFNKDEILQSVNQFSGGWRMRLNIAQALICPSNILLLDEPTNHLDLDTIIFLQNFLKNYDGTILCVSHDRDFLDSFCSDIMHFENNDIVMYKGNYSDYERLISQKISHQQKALEKQEARLDKMQKFVDRFRYKATKAKQAQSMIKAMEKIQRVDVTKLESGYNFKFEAQEFKSDLILNIENATLGYENKDILNNVKFQVFKGDRIGLLGKNGQGKSTLIKSLVGLLKLKAGTLNIAKDVKIGYFAQHELEQLNPDQSALEHLRLLDPMAYDKDLRSFLASFGFSQDLAVQKVADLSGGQMARLALAIIAYQKPHILLLDEPTNHLDIQTRQALARALCEFSGALILVSHDRYLLNLLSEKLFLIADKSLREFVGDLNDYAQFLQSSNLEPKAKEDNNGTLSDYQKLKANKKQDALLRQKASPLKKQVLELEAKMDECKDRIKSIDDKFNDPSLYANDKKAVGELTIQRNDLLNEIQELENKWLELNEQIENILNSKDI